MTNSLNITLSSGLCRWNTDPLEKAILPNLPPKYPNPRQTSYNPGSPPPTRENKQNSANPECSTWNFAYTCNHSSTRTHTIAGGRMSDEAGQWSATSGSAHCYTGRCIVLPGYTKTVVVYEVLLRRCRERKREKERERERGRDSKEKKGRGKRAKSLRGSVGNSARRRVVNFRLHRRAASRLPWSTFLSFFCTLFLPLWSPSRYLFLFLSLPLSLSLSLSASFHGSTAEEHSPTQQTPRLPSYSSRAYDSASLRLNAYADCR